MLRKEMTPAEAVLWEKIRNKKLDSYKFRRQHPIGIFIADFFCYEAMLVIELDGSIHHEVSQGERDIERTRIINRHGIKVIRFSNEQVLNNLEFVLEAVHKELTSRVL